jgi:hypothetical protein
MDNGLSRRARREAICSSYCSRRAKASSVSGTPADESARLIIYLSSGSRAGMPSIDWWWLGCSRVGCGGTSSSPAGPVLNLIIKPSSFSSRAQHEEAFHIARLLNGAVGWPRKYKGRMTEADKTSRTNAELLNYVGLA